MFSFTGTSGSGIAAVGTRPRADGLHDLAAIDTVVDGDPLLPRKAGMGGPRYLRHCLEVALLGRGGLWLPETMQQASDVLTLIDGGGIGEARILSAVYVTDGDSARHDRDQAWTARPDVPFQTRRIPERTHDWAALLTRLGHAATDELGRPSLVALWVDGPAAVLAQVARGDETAAARALVALVAIRARAERAFLAQTASGAEADARSFHTLLSARVVRAACLLAASSAGPHPELRVPELTELGRTILLAVAAGWLPEARELGFRVRPWLQARGADFVPPVARLALAWASGLDLPFDPARDTVSGTTAEADCAALLASFADSTIAIEGPLLRLLEARRRLYAGFDDVLHTDFDEDLMTIIPVEVLAMSRLRGVATPGGMSIDHPLMDLPTARLPDLSAVRPDFSGVQALFLAQCCPPTFRRPSQ
jgi:hypothetical protein